MSFIRWKLHHIVLAVLIAMVLTVPLTAAAATKSASRFGQLTIYLAGGEAIAFPFTANTSFQWWGSWVWDFYFNNWATDTWDLRIGATVTNGRVYAPAFIVEPVQPYAWWVDLVTWNSLMIPPGQFYNIGCIVSTPNSCLQTAYFGGGTAAGVYLVGKGQRWQSQIMVWRPSYPWEYTWAYLPNIDLW